VVETTDAHGELHLDRKQLSVAMAVCRACRRRFRVLPSDVLPHKRYALAVIARLVHAHTLGDQSLRMAAWTTHLGTTPAHSTLHAWTEGLGAHVLGRPFGSQPGASPFQVVLGQTSARWSSLALARLPQPPIDPQRHRSEDRRERLVAGAGLLQLALTVAKATTPSTSEPATTTDALCAWRRLAVEFGVLAPFAFQTGIRRTPFEHRVPRPRQSSGSPQQTGDPTCQKYPTRSRSPPGGSSRSLPTSLSSTTSPNGDV
jgi:hypothetical protein